MRIGIDIDGVLTDMARFIEDYAAKFCYDNNIKYVTKPEEYRESEALGITNEQVEKFWNTYLEYYATKYPARKFAAEVISKLKEKGHEIYIITARNDRGLPPETYGTMKNMVKEWLQTNNIIYDKLIFSTNSKLGYCLENNIEIMIDDSPYVLEDVSTKIPMLCFDNPYNKNINKENIKRVYSWYDILVKIEEI